MIWVVLPVLALACAFLALSLLLDYVLQRPLERRWRR